MSKNKDIIVELRILQENVRRLEQSMDKQGLKVDSSLDKLQPIVEHVQTVNRIIEIAIKYGLPLLTALVGILYKIGVRITF